MNRYFSYMLPRERAQPCSQAEKMGEAHDESPGVKADNAKLKLPPKTPKPASNSIESETGNACELSGLRAGDNVRIGGKLKDDRVYKFISAEWDNTNGECYAYVQAHDAQEPIRVLASGIAKINLHPNGRGKALPTGRDGKFTTYAEVAGRRG